MSPQGDPPDRSQEYLQGTGRPCRLRPVGGTIIVFTGSSSHGDIVLEMELLRGW